ncbi:hypothetical protein [Nonomuraea sp. NPDC050310]|uniref:hypothetical protein n=1 Tax=Nonomuraea sp. NPDC050310 TaxID=3154935 RepID=UPI0033D262BA
MSAGPESVHGHEDLVRLLARQFALADLSLRELESRADRAGGTRLPRATVADMLAGRRFPRRAVMLAFLRACRVPEAELPAWDQAWERAQVARVTQGSRAGTPSPAPPEAPETLASTTAPAAGATPAATVPAATVPGATVPEAAAPGALAPGAGAAGASPSPAEVVATVRALVPEQPVHASEPSQPSRTPVLKPSLFYPARPGRRPVVVGAVIAGTVAVAGAVATGVLIGRRATPAPPTPAERLLARPVTGHIVSDDGRAFGPGGSSRFTVHVDPANTGVRLIRRLDVGVPLQQAKVTVNGAKAGQWRPLLGDTDYKWRDQVFQIPAGLTAGRRALAIVNTFVAAEGFNEFRYLVEHRVGGTWSAADRLDVGDAASEAAHGYRIVGEGWRGTQTFAYPPLRKDWTVR